MLGSKHRLKDPEGQHIQKNKNKGSIEGPKGSKLRGRPNRSESGLESRKEFHITPEGSKLQNNQIRDRKLKPADLELQIGLHSKTR